MTAVKERMYLRSFQENSKVLSSTLSVDEVLDHIVRQITEVMNLKGATIRLVNPKTNRLELAAAHGLSEKYLQKGAVDLDKSVTEALSGRPVAIFDAVNDAIGIIDLETGDILEVNQCCLDDVVTMIVKGKDRNGNQTPQVEYQSFG